MPFLPSIQYYNPILKVTKGAALVYRKGERPGRIEMRPTKSYRIRTDLSLAYSLGVTYPCLEIRGNENDTYRYTDKGNLVAVISNGTAVLGLEDIGAISSKPVMEGKGLLFEMYGDIDVFDIKVNEKDPVKFCEAVGRIAPSFGGIDLKDIKVPECFYIKERLKKNLDIPVMHDDQHDAAIISAAGLKSALEVAGKDIKKAKSVINGAGAAAISCTKLYVALGVKKENILMLDSYGVITTDRTGLNPERAIFATSRKDVHTLEKTLKDADVFVGLSRGNILSKDMIRSMASNPIVFALISPAPEISYEDAPDSQSDVIMLTGHSDYPNQINNVIGFPYIFRGALDVHTRAIGEEMKMTAVHAVTDLAKQPIPDVVDEVHHINGLSFGPKCFIPKPTDPHLITAVSTAVAKATVESGMARTPIKDWDKYKENLKQLLGRESKFTGTLHATVARHPQRIVFAEGGHPTMMKAVVQARQEDICFPILLGNPDRLNRLANRLKLDLTGIKIIDMRADKEQGKRAKFAKHMSEELERQGYTFGETYDKMYERNYFGMSMVENGNADGFITGLYTKYSSTIKVVKKMIGIRLGFKTFATMHILDTKKGIYYIFNTLTNRYPDKNVLYDIARPSTDAVRFFSDKPIMAVISYSNFGTDTIGSPQKVHTAVEKVQQEFPDLVANGEMQINFTMDKELRDDKYPFTRLKGKSVNTLIFSNMNSVDGSYKLLQIPNSDTEIIDSMQMGLEKPTHFTNFECSVHDIINITVVTAIDACVEKIKNSKE